VLEGFNEKKSQKSPYPTDSNHTSHKYTTTSPTSSVTANAGNDPQLSDISMSGEHVIDIFLKFFSQN
jgi:hypothetical protein